MNSQTSRPEGDSIPLDHIPAGEATSQGQNVPLEKWGFVFHRFNSAAGNFFNINVGISDSLGGVIERARTQYQALLPISWLRRFVSKVVVERATVDHSPTYDLESQNFPIQVKANTNVRDEQLTEAFHNPQKFYDVFARGAELAVFLLPIQSSPLSQTVVSFRTVLDRKRLFWMLVILMLAILLLAGVVAGVVSKNMGTACLIVGALMGLFGLIAAVAAVLWKA